MDGSEISSSTLEFSTTTNGISILFYCFTQNDPNLDSTINNCEFKPLSSNRTEKPNYSTLVHYYEVFIDKQFFIVRFTGSPTLNIISLRAKSNDNTNTNNNNTYVKRRIPTGRSAMNIYKPRKADLRLRNQEKATDDYYDNINNNLEFGQNNKGNYLKNKNIINFN